MTHIRDRRTAYRDLPATTPYTHTHTHRLSPYSDHLSHASRTPFSAPGTSCEAHAQSPRNLGGSRAKHAEEPDNRILFTRMHAQLREIRRRRISRYLISRFLYYASGDAYSPRQKLPRVRISYSPRYMRPCLLAKTQGILPLYDNGC